MKDALILIIDIAQKRGIQEYNRRLFDSLESGFPDVNFTAIALLGSVESGRAGPWRNVDLKYCGNSMPVFLKKILFVIKALFYALVQRPKFLLCCHVDLSPIAFLLKKIYGLKYAVLTHGIDCWQIKSGVKYSGLKAADIITSISEYSRDKMISNGVDAGKIKILHNTVDTSLFRRKNKNYELMNRLGIKDRRILLTVGKISSKERYKGHDVMLDVIAALGKEYVWVVVGQGDDLGRLENKAKDSGISEKVRFVGEIAPDERPDYYNLCDIFVMPSKGEGFGIVFLEAMACGKPVIGGNRDGSSEPLMRGRLGFLVDPDDAKEIANAVENIFTAKDKRLEPDYLIKETEENFGTDVFKKEVKKIFSGAF